MKNVCHINLARLQAQMTGEILRVRQLRKKGNKALTKARALRQETRDPKKKGHTEGAALLEKTDRLTYKAECLTRVSGDRELALALAYLKGRTYLECERTCREKPDAGAVAKYVSKAILGHNLEDTQRVVDLWLETGTTRLGAINLCTAEIKKIRDEIQRLYNLRALNTPHAMWKKRILVRAEGEHRAAKRIYNLQALNTPHAMRKKRILVRAEGEHRAAKRIYEDAQKSLAEIEAQISALHERIKEQIKEQERQVRESTEKGIP